MTPTLYSCVLLATAVAFFGCDSRSATPPTITIKLATDATTYGAIVTVRGFRGSSSEIPALACSAAEGASARECVHHFAVEEDGTLRLAFRGCDLSDGDALAICSGRPEELEKIRRAAEVRVGCGCALVCPETPRLQICDDDGDCVSTGTESSRSARSVSSTSSTRTSVTNATVCPTCCESDFAPTAYVSVPDAVSELTIRIPYAGECRNSDCSTTSARSRFGYARGAIEICLASETGREIGEAIDCLDLGLDFQDAIISGALDPNFNEIDPAPKLTVRFVE
jgi:hypothetical protein